MILKQAHRQSGGNSVRRLIFSWRLRDTIMTLIGALIMIALVVIINETPKDQTTKYVALFLVGVAAAITAVGNALQRRR